MAWIRAAVLCAIVALSGSAHAQRRPVAVIDLSATEPGRNLADDLYRVLVNHFDLQPMSAMFQASLQGPFLDEDRPAMEEARKSRQEAEDALAQLDYATAARSARRGMDQLAFVMPASEMLGLYAELAFAWGQAQLGMRKPQDASLAFGLANRLDPSKRPDPMRYEPGIITAYQTAVTRKQVAAQIYVKGTGRVWIDGVDVGTAAGVYSVTEGLHLIQLSGPERETRGDQVIVPVRKEVEIAPAPATEELKIRRARVALRNAPDPTARVAAIKKLAHLTGVADAVLIAKGDGDKLVVQTWRAQSGFSAIVKRGNEKPIDLLTPLAPARNREPPKEDGKRYPPPLVVEQPWHEKNWVRASAAGTIVVAVIVGVLFATRDRMLTFDENITRDD